MSIAFQEFFIVNDIFSNIIIAFFREAREHIWKYV